MSKILIGIPYLEETDVNSDGSLKAHVCKGKPVVVMVQGNFCGYCTSAKPDFQRFAQTAQNVSSVTVQIDGGPMDKRANKKLSLVNTSPGVPAFLGFDSQGNFVKIHQGNRDIASLQGFASSL